MMPTTPNRFGRNVSDSRLAHVPETRSRALPSAVTRLQGKGAEHATEDTPSNFVTPKGRFTATVNERTPKLDDVDDKVSPGLARLRMTPGVLRQKQKHLIDQHNEIMKKSDQLSTGGGVSLWPNMKQMRLSTSEIIQLAVQAISLCIFCLFLLNKLHGELFHNLYVFRSTLSKFCHNFQITEVHTDEMFEKHVISWHNGLLNITENIGNYYNMPTLSTSYQAYLICYLIGISTLLYYLLDNMWAKNKLSPTRIKKWACLLAVVGAWTCVMVYGIYLAHVLETQAVKCVQIYSSSLSFLVTLPLDLTKYHNVLLYWRSRFLDSHADGLLHVLGAVSVRNIIFYLQFYSVPIFTILVSPVIKLCGSCFEVYSNGKYIKD